MRKVKRLRLRKLPVTVDEAVERLLLWLPEKTQRDLAQAEHMYRDTKSTDMRMLGMAIRNEFGLWNDISPLRDATGEKHPDDASGVILRALHKRLRPTGRRVRTRFHEVGGFFRPMPDEEY